MFLFSNNASTTLAAPLTSTATSMTVATGTGANFPNPTDGNIFALTLVDAATGTIREVVYVTAASVDTFTIERGQEGTTAQNWNTGDYAQNLLTGGTAANFLQPDKIQAETNPIYPPLLATGDAQSLCGLWVTVGAPSNADGNNGDFAFRQDGVVAGNFIYKKISGAWTPIL